MTTPGQQSHEALPDLSALHSCRIRWEFDVELPEVPAIYILINSAGEALYVGQAKNLRERWRGLTHHRILDALAAGDELRFLPCEPERLVDLEKQYIAALKPPLNNAPPSLSAAGKIAARLKHEGADNTYRIGAEVAGMRRRETKPCAVCGTPMTGLASRKTCSDACRAKLSRGRKRKP